MDYTPVRNQNTRHTPGSSVSTGNRSFPVKRLNTDEELPLTQPSLKDLFKGVVAHVDVRSDIDNRSGVIAAELERYGAKILKKFSKNATHLIFKNGSKAVYDKAKMLKIPIVSSMWIDACREQGQLLPESSYPPFCAHVYDSPFAKIKRTRSMQPRPLEENLKLVSRQLARKKRKNEDVAIDRSFEDILPVLSPPRSTATGIDFFIENSPCVQERIRRKIAAGTPYHKLFEFDEDEDENDTPVSFNVIKKYYFSPNKPPPASIKKIMAEVEVKSHSETSDNAGSPVLFKRPAPVKQTKDQTSSTVQETFNSSKTPTKDETNNPKRKRTRSREPETESQKDSSGPPKDETSVPSRKRKKTLEKQVQQTEETNNPSPDLGTSSSTEGRRFSARLQAKASGSCEGKSSSDKAGSEAACRKVLFRKRKQFLPPDSLIVSATPPGEVLEKVKDQGHPCFTQSQRNGKRKRGRPPSRKKDPEPVEDAVPKENIVRSITGNRNSLDEFVLSRPVKRAKNDKEKQTTIVCTSLHQEQMKRVKYVIEYLGGFKLADTADAKTSHVVCGSARRTLNVLHGMVHGAKIVTYQWALDSEAAGQWLSEDAYPVEPFSNVALVYRNYQVSSSEKCFVLFTHLGKFYVSPRSSVPVDDLKRLVEQVGGRLTNNIREADYIIGEFHRSNKMVCLNPTWILDCIQQCQVMPTDKYLLHYVSPKS